jgi:hypothetical protein
MRAWALLVLLPTLVIGVLIYLAIQEADRWEAFAAAHSCKLVTRTPVLAVPSVGLSSTGQPVIETVIIPEHKAYLCDDNKTYWR